MAKIIATVGLGFGDEGKGTIVDYLAHKCYRSPAIVRYSGGSQAAHNVITENKHHTFSQFGSGMLTRKCSFFISKHMLINPAAMLYEEEILQSKVNYNISECVYIDRNCKIITPYHKFAGRIRELWRGRNNIGSCGMGVGEAALDTLSVYVKDIYNTSLLYKKLKEIRNAKVCIFENFKSCEAAPEFNEMVSLDINSLVNTYKKFVSRYNIVDVENVLQQIANDDIPIIFEGSQGTLLDKILGFYPHITKTDVSLNNANKLIDRIKKENSEIQRIGILRTYAHRHGKGPLPTCSMVVGGEEKHNLTNKWQGNFYKGYMDLVLSKYAVSVNKQLDCLAITHLDVRPYYVCFSYIYDGDNLDILNKCFEYKNDSMGPIIYKIKHGANIALVGRLLRNCRPWEVKIVNNTREFINLIQNILELPVKIISGGPTNKDKREYED